MSVDAKRKAAERMRRQGVVGWVLYHPMTGLVLHLYRTLEAAVAAAPAIRTQHLVDFDVLGVHGSGDAYRQIEGRLTERARDKFGSPVRVPLRGRRIHAPYVREHVLA